MHDFKEETICFFNNGFPIYGYRRMIYDHRVFCLYTLSVNGPFLLKILLLIFEITFVTYVVHLVSGRPIWKR